LDYKGLITPAQENGDPINKFGSEIVAIASGADLVSKVNNDAMQNKVFYVEAASLPSGNLDINSEIIFNIGQNKDSGAGIIIIEGNLTINKNISYQASGGAAPVIRYLKNIPSAVWIVKGDVILDPSVTNLAGTFVVLGDSEIMFKIGGNKDSGAGIIIIEGNLTINKNISYQASGGAAPVIRYLKNIPSAVWIVKGDVILDPSVTNLAGTFVVLGDGNSCSVPQAGCGQFKTGSVMSSADLQLKVSGSVLAKRFYLDRLFVDTNPNSPTYQEPAEKFSNDGRLQANPPLGLSDFSKSIPRFSN
jgi:hypothetical protein